MRINRKKFKEIRLKKNLSQDKIAKALNVSQSLIKAWESGQTVRFGSIQQVIDLSFLLDTPPNELIDDVDSFYFKELTLRGKLDLISLPVLELNQIIPWLDKNKLPTQARSITVVKTKELSGKSYCITIDGDAMSCEDPKLTFIPDEVVGVDPERTIKSGDVVLVDTNQSGIKLRQYVKDGTEILLKAFNKTYPAMTYDEKVMRILGVAIFTYRDRI